MYAPHHSVLSLSLLFPLPFGCSYQRPLHAPPHSRSVFSSPPNFPRKCWVNQSNPSYHNIIKKCTFRASIVITQSRNNKTNV